MSLAVALLTASLASSSPTMSQPADAACAKPGPKPAAEMAVRNGAKRLDRLPPHQHFMTVIRRESRCEVAVIKQDGRNHIVPLPDQQGLQPLETRQLER